MTGGGGEGVGVRLTFFLTNVGASLPRTTVVAAIVAACAGGRADVPSCSVLPMVDLDDEGVEDEDAIDCLFPLRGRQCCLLSSS